MCDVDHFKAFNGRHGHPAGDECLKQVAAALRSCCRRPGDIAARYGGEEFALVLPDTELAAAVRVAESARLAVARLARAARPSNWRLPSASAAASRRFHAARRRVPEALILAADTALFGAKRRGRNRIVQAPIEAATRRRDVRQRTDGIARQADTASVTNDMRGTQEFADDITASIADLVPGFLDDRRRDVVSIFRRGERGDFEAVRRLGHNMRGSGGGYGFDAITDFGAALELAAMQALPDEIRTRTRCCSDTWTNCPSIIRSAGK
jgi:diguanylate cyclase (GGDEF)-like protein